MPALRPITFRRATAAALAAVMLLTVLPAATMAGEYIPSDAIQAAERMVLDRMNVVRANNGVGPLRMARGVRRVARDRSVSMKYQNYFGHVSPTGANAATLLNRRGVKWNSWGENIGWTVYMDVDEGPRWMVNWWKQSAPHRRNILNRNFNYAGVGIVKDGPKLLYTVVFVNQYDHTPPYAQVVGSDSVISIASTLGSTMARDVQVSWYGWDRRLSVRTSGLKGFIVQYKKVGGTWRTIRWMTTRRELTKDLRQGGHKFRVRAVDWRGNKSAWSMVKVKVS
jgi:uncharacterized protein YkwD